MNWSKCLIVPVFETIPACQSMTEITNLKKIKGHKHAYRTAE